jgi:hypothetical protein
VDAATVVAAPAPLTGRTTLRGEDAALRLGQTLEGCVRSLSNLLERLHHSSAFYIMLSPGRFLGAAVYMPPGGLLLGALLLCGAGCATRGAGAHWPNTPPTHDWAHAMTTAAGVYGASMGAGVLLLRVLLPARDAAGGAPDARLLLLGWALTTAAACAVSLALTPAVVLRDARPLRAGPWVPLKALTLAATCLWLAQGIILNTGLALPYTALLVPACLAARPAPPGGALGGNARAARAARWLLLAAASPPVVVCLAALALECAPGDVLWRVARHAAEWDTLCAALAFGAYLPCFLVCTAILAA